jgi:ATP-dependent helicase HrpA
MAAELVPSITYPDLPVSARRDDIAAAIRDHQVVILAGETGSGKTTQLPKICLQLGRGVAGQIGHTQPRRIAARAVAERVAEELGSPLGEAVGYQVRFTDRSSERTLVKVMTDGILLAEIQRDRLLRRYDTIIIDEAHERSLTIDFLIGYLKEILPSRPDLKVVVTSATIDTARFAQHFADADGTPAPVVEVSGRTYPVEVRYRPYGIDEGDDRDQVQAVVDAVRELLTGSSGDVLVFLSGEREIRDTADALAGAGLTDTEILPLFARLSSAAQHKVFEPHPGRRVVLATNVAETSLTVPGIRFVVDPGTARMSRYSHRTKVQRLPIERVSQASADQRAGRCGRVADGIAIRLYGEADYLARPEFTEPEILRTNLASVILSMTALGLGDILAFPFVEAPDRRQVRDGVDLLRELGAVQEISAGEQQRLTPVGRRLAQLPLDPRLGRMVLEADEQGCVAEVLVVAAALSIQDPRERPADKQAQADQLHARFKDPTSDFASMLKLWEYIQEQQKSLSGNQFRRMCQRELLHYLRVREWQDVESQLRRACKDMGIAVSSAPGEPVRMHTALLAGLLSHIGAYDTDRRDYLGARGARFAIHPGSALARRPPAFVMAAELVETSRLFARVAARIDPEWVERVAGDLVARSYSEPRWSKKRAAVLATERVTLYGVPLVVGRAVSYGRIDPELSRDLFIRHALVLQEWDAHHGFLRANAALVAELAELEDRVRRRDLLVDDQVLVDFYDERIPADIVSGRDFDHWWKAARRETPDLLTLPRELLVTDEGAEPDDLFPRVWSFGDDSLPDLPLAYAFDPGASDDGVMIDVPVALLHRLRTEEFLRQVPGRREEVVTALVRSLPKDLRKRFVPVPDTVRAVLPELPGDRPLAEELAAALTRRAGLAVPPTAFDTATLPNHLVVTFRVVGEDGAELGRGNDLALLRRDLAPQVQRTLAAAAPGVAQSGLVAFPPGGIPRQVHEVVGDVVVIGHPALVDRLDHVDVVVLPTAAEQSEAMVLGVRRLLLLAVPTPVKTVVAGLSTRQKLALGHTPYPSVPATLADVLVASVAAIAADKGPMPYGSAEFDALVLAVREDLVPETTRAVQVLADVLTLAWQVRSRLSTMSAKALLPLVSDVTTQLDALVGNGFVGQSGVRRLPHLVRYLRAMDQRLDKAPADLDRDRVKVGEVAQVQRAVDQARIAYPGEASQALRWMVEELRVSLFAQGLGTAHPVSSTRILRAIAAMT